MPRTAQSLADYRASIRNRSDDQRAAAVERHIDLLTNMDSSLQEEFIYELGQARRIVRNSTGYQRILTSLEAINAVMDTIVTEETQALVREPLIDTYAALIQQCDEYLDTHSGYRFTSVGKKRVALIRDLRSKADDEAQLLMERLNTVGSFGQGITLWQLFAGMRPLQEVTAQASQFLLPKAAVPTPNQAPEPAPNTSDDQVEEMEEISKTVIPQSDSGPAGQAKASARASIAEVTTQPETAKNPQALAEAALAGAVQSQTAPQGTTTTTTSATPEKVVASAIVASEQAVKAGIAPDQTAKAVLRKVPVPDYMDAIRVFREEIQREALLNDHLKAIFDIMLEQVERAVQRKEDILCVQLLDRVIALCGENAGVGSLMALSQVCAAFQATKQSSDSDLDTKYAPQPQLSSTAYPGDDQVQNAFPEYRHLDPAVVRYLAQNLSFNRGETANHLYGQDLSGTPTGLGAAHGYMQTDNSSKINIYLAKNAAAARHPSPDNPNPAPLSFASTRTIGLIDQAANAYRLPWKTRLHRMVTTSYLKRTFGIPEGDGSSFTGRAAKIINERAGTIISDPSIMSTGFYVDTLFSSHPVSLTLLCDEGTPVFPTRNMAEGEIVLGRGTTYMILSAVIHTKDNPLALPASHLMAANQFLEGQETQIQGVNLLEIFAKVLPSPDSEENLSQSAEKFRAFQQKQTAYEPKFQGDHRDMVHRDAYLEMARADQASLTELEAAAMDEYTHDSGDINRRMRAGEVLSDVTGAQNALIRQAFAKHRIPVDMEVYRGVSDTFLSVMLKSNPVDEDVKANAFTPDGSLNHAWLDAEDHLDVFKGMVFQDAAFLSTSTNKPFARRWANHVAHDRVARNKGLAINHHDPNRDLDIAGAHVITMKLPAGTRAMFTDTMFTRTGQPRGQDEVTVDAGYTYLVEDISKAGPGRYEITMRCIG